MDKEYLFDVIDRIEKQKEANHIEPRYAMRNEIMAELYADMRKTLNTLLKDKRINYRKTLNSWAIETTTKR